MTEKTPSNARLLELLDIRDAELSDARSTIEKLERQIDFEVDWMRQVHTKQDEHDLPVPRLQLLYIPSDYCASEWEVSLVHKQRGGDVARVPLHYSKRSGAYEDYQIPENLEDEEVQRQLCFMLPSSVSDLCYAHDTMGLPAFVVIKGKAARVETKDARGFKLVAP